MLLFRNGYFLQLLEGPDQAVAPKKATIKHDDRHTKVTVLTEELIEERQFPEWTMGYPAEDTDVEQAPGTDDLRRPRRRRRHADQPLPALRELIRWFRPRPADHGHHRRAEDGPAQWCASPSRGWRLLQADAVEFGVPGPAAEVRRALRESDHVVPGLQLHRDVDAAGGVAQPDVVGG